MNEIYMATLRAQIVSLEARLKCARDFSMNIDISYIEATLLEAQIAALKTEFNKAEVESGVSKVNQEQKVYEAGLLAVVDTARKAYVEGFRKAAELSCCVHDQAVEQHWLNSNVCEVCTKAVEDYTGKKL